MHTITERGCGWRCVLGKTKAAKKHENTDLAAMANVLFVLV